MPSPPDSGGPAVVRCIVTTFSKEEEATEIIRTLVREQLAACGTLLRGARSIYIWQDSLEDSEEIVVIFKTTADAVRAATARLKEVHSYEMPEILIFAPDDAEAAYAQWVMRSCSKLEAPRE